MANSYSWSFTAMERVFGPDENGNTDIVVCLMWRYTGVDAGGRMCSFPGRSVLSVTEDTDFVDFDDISEADAIAWAEASVGEHEMEAMRREIDADIAEQTTPTRTIVLSDSLPWRG